MPVRTFLYLLGLLSALVVATYAGTILKAADRWSSDPQYSHGYLIPVFSLFLLYHRSPMLAAKQLHFSAFGFLFLALGLALRWAEYKYFLNGLDPLSLLPMLAGAVLIAGGWHALNWAWPSVGFLVFMVPLPFRLQTAFSGQLQRIATDMSTFVLQTVGAPAVAEGNVIVLEVARIGVVEACSGLGMVVTFVAFSAAVALLVKSPWWVKLGLMLGSLPVAVFANVARITVTGLLYNTGHSESAKALFHDLAGWFMMPLGIAVIFVELYVLDRIVTMPDSAHDDNESPLQLPYSAPA